jgi:hypothetical protein
MTASFDRDERRFAFGFRYALPDSVEELEVTVPELAGPELSVADSSGFERPDGTTFAWAGDAHPWVTLRCAVETGLYAGSGYVTDDAAFTATPRTSLAWRYRGIAPTFVRDPSFDGEGHAGTGWTYAGPFDTEVRSSGRTTYTAVVPAETGEAGDPDGVLELYADADGRFPTLLDYDTVSVFLVPSDRLAASVPAGVTANSSVLLDAGLATVDAVDSIAPHEYVHAQLGDLGDGSMTWLAEGSAEYYGLLLALNAGLGTVGAFLDHVRTDEYADAVLVDVRAGDATRADYRKGAHVCAALDAEIRRRSSGDRTLLAVVTSPDHDVTAYDGFRSAVVAAAGDEAMADWVDRHVRTSALPEIPEERDLYTLGDTDPGALRTATPSPTPSPTPTASPTPSPTVDRAGTPFPTTAGTATTESGDGSDGGDPAPATTPGFGPLAAVGGTVLAALLARRRGR